MQNSLSFHQSYHTNPFLQRRTCKMHSLEYSSFPSLIFVPCHRGKAHRASFLQGGGIGLPTGMWAGCRQGKSCHQPLSKGNGKVGHSPYSPRAALPGASEMSLQIIQASKNTAIIQSHTKGHIILCFVSF